jgi:hypothetical protein
MSDTGLPHTGSIRRFTPCRLRSNARPCEDTSPTTSSVGGASVTYLTRISTSGVGRPSGERFESVFKLSAKNAMRLTLGSANANQVPTKNA